MVSEKKMNFEGKIRMIANMQKQYDKLVTNKKITKQAICEVCCPVKDSLHLTDLQTLQIARKEMSLYDIIKILDEQERK